MYALEFTLEARDDLSGLDRPIARRILSKLHWLAENVEAIAPERMLWYLTPTPESWGRGPMAQLQIVANGPRQGPFGTIHCPVSGKTCSSCEFVATERFTRSTGLNSGGLSTFSDFALRSMEDAEIHGRI
jgi:hypothetical protein